MDPRPFARSNTPAALKARDWALPVTQLLLGVLCLWHAIHQSPPSLATGWLAMIGLVLCLHFGAFGLLALFWRLLGIDVQPIMRAPIQSRSVAEFWGARWNTAFSELARRFILRPLARRWDLRSASLAVFVFSGLIHELVISLPARAGVGLPTAYFLLQWVGVQFERSKLGRRFGLGKGAAGWLFAMVVVGGPAFWLFHPVFVRRVILPMLEASH